MGVNWRFRLFILKISSLFFGLNNGYNEENELIAAHTSDFHDDDGFGDHHAPHETRSGRDDFSFFLAGNGFGIDLLGVHFREVLHVK